MGLRSSSLLGSLRSGKIQNQLMENRIVPPAEGVGLFVEPNDQTMTLSSSNVPCLETRTPTLWASGAVSVLGWDPMAYPGGQFCGAGSV